MKSKWHKFVGLLRLKLTKVNWTEIAIQDSFSHFSVLFSYFAFVRIHFGFGFGFGVEWVLFFLSRYCLLAKEKCIKYQWCFFFFSSNCVFSQFIVPAGIRSGSTSTHKKLMLEKPCIYNETSNRINIPERIGSKRPESTWKGLSCSESAWKDLSCSETVWTFVKGFELLWNGLNRLGRTSNALKLSGSAWKHLSCFETAWISLNQLGTAQTGLKCPRSTWAVWNRLKMLQVGLDHFDLHVVCN